VARPKQARSRETLRRILDAAEGLIAEKGLADASIPEIVRRAGSSVGGFYARFKDKDELLRALEERFFRELSERLEALSAEARGRRARVAEVAAVCAHELVRTARERLNLIAAFLHRATWDEATRREALRFRGRVAERVRELVLERGEPLRHPEPALAIDLAVQLAFGLIFQLVMAGEVRAGGRVLSDAELEREIARSFLRVIGVPDADAPLPAS
jgi:AcrR family transcriptional regulator